MTYFTSRSRVEQFQTCARKRFLGSEYEGRGLESSRLSLPLVVGSAIHWGVEVLLKIDQLGIALDDPQLMLICDLCQGEPVPETQGGGTCPKCKGAALPPIYVGGISHKEPIDIAVAAALAEFEQAYQTHEVDATVNESMQFIHDEHAALIEGLLRLWAAHPDGLPWLLREYEVLEVERWDFKELVAAKPCPYHAAAEQRAASGAELEFCRACDGTDFIGGITLRSRADALLRKRSDGGLYVWSLKTANSWDKRRDDSGRHDVQGISEMVCIEERLRQQWELNSTDDENVEPTPLRIDGTQMTYLLKGRRELDEKLNVYRIKSALLHPWSIDAGLLGEKQYAHTYWYDCELPHETGRTLKSGKAVLCEGGKRHNIGTSWSQCNVWEHMPMKEWVALLLSGDVQPSMPLPTFFINPEPYFRNQTEVEDWIEQVTAQEQEVVEGLALLGQASEDGRRSVLNRKFRQTRGACDHDYGGSCVFVDICFGPGAIADDPVGSGLYRLRTPVEMEVTE